MTTSEIVRQLRKGLDPYVLEFNPEAQLREEAAEEIERLNAKVDRLTSRGIEDMHARIEELETAIERAIRSLDVAETGGDAQEVSDRLRRLLTEDSGHE